MRFSEYEQRLENLQIDASLPVFGADSTIKNLNAFRELMQQLQQMPYFSKAAEPLLHSAIFTTNRDRFQVSATEYHSLQVSVDWLKTAIQVLQGFLFLKVPKISSESVFIKLPSSPDLKGILRDCVRIEEGIERIILEPEIGGAIFLESWEDGSHWLRVCLKTTAAVYILGQLVTASVMVRNAWHRDRLVAEQVRRYEIGNRGQCSKIKFHAFTNSRRSRFAKPDAARESVLSDSE